MKCFYEAVWGSLGQGLLEMSTCFSLTPRGK
jgi:hypothetical protein